MSSIPVTGTSEDRGGGSGGGGGNPFVCNICRRSYGRVDHLARHFRSHTNERPFKCMECGKSFARADLLKRHATLHTTNEDNKKRKIRASQACGACAIIKVKCDQEKPCKRCRAKGLECRVETGQASSSTVHDDRLTLAVSPVQHRAPQSLPSPGTSCPALDDRPRGSEPLVPTPPLASHITSGIPSHVAPFPANHAPSADDSSLTNLLNHVIHPGDASLSASSHSLSNFDWRQTGQSRDLMNSSQDLSLDFSDLDALLRGDWATWLDPMLTAPAMDQSINHSGQSSNPQMSSIDDSINLGIAAYSRSAWRWIPNHEKGYQDQALASVLAASRENKLPRPRQVALVPPMDHSERDRIVALLLAACDKTNFQKISTLFPSPRVLDVFLNDYLLIMEHSIDSWIHIPTFRTSEAIPELLTLLIAGGAILGRSNHAQRFGYALHDKGRMANREMFDRDNSNTRRLSSLQCAALYLGIGLWSGDRRNMELAESSTQPLVTMVRRSGRFRNPPTTPEPPLPSDSPDVLDGKWHKWVEAESYKRLAYHVFLHCVQMSIAFQTPPLVSYTEITLDLPAPAPVWRAGSAEEWRNQYHIHRLAGAQVPSFISSISDVQVIGSARQMIDFDFTIYLTLMGHWWLAWDYTQLSSANKQAPTNAQWAGIVLATSKRQELQQLMDSFQNAIEDWGVFVPKEVHMISQLLRMNLCVSFEDLQLIAGKEGVGEARRVYLSLKQWYQSPDCRQALWHAGQVLRAARRPAGRSPHASAAATPDTPWLRDFNAIALYHAGLGFWAYGVLSKAIVAEQHSAGYQQRAMKAESSYLWPPPIDYEGISVHLDGSDEEFTPSERHDFIALNKGLGVISVHSPFPRAAGSLVRPSMRSPSMSAADARKPETDAALAQRETVALDNTKRVMEVMINALTPGTSSSGAHMGHSNSHSPGVGLQRPALVENVIQLMRDLGEAAAAV